jgi:hypothetical protein
MVESKPHLPGIDKLKQLNKVCWWLPASGNEVASCTLI